MKNRVFCALILANLAFLPFNVGCETADEPEIVTEATSSALIPMPGDQNCGNGPPPGTADSRSWHPALEAMNRVRMDLGLYCFQGAQELFSSAWAHADYVVVNTNTPSCQAPIYGNQVPGCTAFSRVTPEERMVAYGIGPTEIYFYPGGGYASVFVEPRDESYSGTSGSLGGATLTTQNVVDSLFYSVYHGLALRNSKNLLAGYGISSKSFNIGMTRTFAVIDFAGTPRVADQWGSGSYVPRAPNYWPHGGSPRVPAKVNLRPNKPNPPGLDTYGFVGTIVSVIRDDWSPKNYLTGGDYDMQLTEITADGACLTAATVAGIPVNKLGATVDPNGQLIDGEYFMYPTQALTVGKRYKWRMLGDRWSGGAVGRGAKSTELIYGCFSPNMATL